ncbi:potassium/sodium hyperpolarization-activated cyclic nucleotide-gated channel 2 isoform X3 [Cotesia glomerata]|uniref:potassium/sodium hyperpolarization-activated cyclic nucleotide-gated channel 2 isoform X3 n=1 Tax=Cotesia glomerata TaxID=32391 RepID=UPI001D002C2B|nr:potassium/sodium hyperpolarization-activated cyclic nucleotide-gated channel 2 isoform X3 [Cotesia glomerata]
MGFWEDCSEEAALEQAASVGRSSATKLLLSLVHNDDDDDDYYNNNIEKVKCNYLNNSNLSENNHTWRDAATLAAAPTTIGRLDYLRGMSSGAKRLVQSLRGRNGGSSASGQTPGGHLGKNDCFVVRGVDNSGAGSTSATRLCYYDSGHELDEISVVGGAATPTTPCHYSGNKYGSRQTLYSIATTVPPAAISTPVAPASAISSIARSATAAGQASTGSYPGLIGGYGDGDKRTGNNARTPDIRLRGEEDTKSVESTVSRSKQSLFDTGFDRLVGKSSNQRYYNQHHYQQHQQSNDSRGRHQEQQIYSVSQRYFGSSRDSLHGGYVNRGASELDLSRKSRRKDQLRGKLKFPNVVSLSSSRDASHLRSLTSTNHLNGNSSCNGTETRYTAQQQQQQRGSRGYPGQPGQRGFRTGAPNWSFVFDPAGRLCYYWSMVVSLAFLYNFWVIIYRFAFQEINGETLVVWFCLDYFSDLLYLVDIVFHFRTGYLEDGVLQTDATKLRNHYMNTTTFYIDCLCLLPLDFLYLSIGFNSILRSFRLVKIYRFWAFMDRTERHTNYPNLFRSTSLIHYLLVIFHWNGCFYHIIYKNHAFGSKNWVYNDSEDVDVVEQYLQSYYWCTLALTTIGDLPRPRSKSEYLFVIVQLLFGLLLFATVLGHVANIVTSVSAARKEFQAKLDGVKTYMRMRRVPNHLQIKVIKWFDYLWLTQKCSDEEKTVSCLPDKLKAEIAINVHLDTLRRVEIFQNTEAGFLCELVLRLRPVLFSPGDYICRKGEVGKEMYIVNRGRLQVVADNGKTVLATLKAGSYFGEISILNMGTAGNRRTASVRSVGYSDLFVLNKKDMWDVLKEYPAARVRLEAIAVKRLEKYKRAPLEKADNSFLNYCAAAMGRSQSTPGLVESEGQITLEEMWLAPNELRTPRSLFSPSPSPITASSLHGLRAGVDTAVDTNTIGTAAAADRTRAAADSPMSATSSARSSEDQTARVPHSTTTQPSIGRQSTHSGMTCNSMTQLMSEGATTPLLGVSSHEALLAEIKRLRERLICLETENAAMSDKLNQQQWAVEHRLAEIEMQICGASSTSSIEDTERNRESII